MDLIGWHPTGTPAAVRIDLYAHWWTLLDALDSELDRYRSLLIGAPTGSLSHSRRRRLQRRLQELLEFKRAVEAQALAAGADTQAGAIAYAGPCPVHGPATGTGRDRRAYTVETACAVVSTCCVEQAA